MGSSESKPTSTPRGGTGVKKDVEVLNLGASSTAILLGMSGLWERVNSRSESSFAVERHFSDWVDRPFMRFYKEYDNMTYTLDLRASHTYASIEGWWNDGTRIKSAGNVATGTWTRNQYYDDTEVEYTVKGRSLCRRSKYRAYGADAPIVTSTYTLSNDGCTLTHVRTVTRHGETGSYKEIFERKESYEETRARVGGVKDASLVIEGVEEEVVDAPARAITAATPPARISTPPTAILDAVTPKIEALEKKLSQSESDRLIAQEEAAALKRALAAVEDRLAAVEATVKER